MILNERILFEEWSFLTKEQLRLVRHHFSGKESSFHLSCGQEHVSRKYGVGDRHMSSSSSTALTD